MPSHASAMDPMHWRMLATAPEYIPPHSRLAEAAGSSLTSAAPLPPPPPALRTTLAATIARRNHAGFAPAGFAPAHSGAPDPIARAPMAAGSGAGIVQARGPPRAPRTLAALLDAAARAQKREITARVHGHLNHDKVFPPASATAATFGATALAVALEQHRQPDPPNADPPPALELHAMRRSPMRRNRRRFHAAGDPLAVPDISAVVERKHTSVDRAAVMLMQLQEELDDEPAPIQQVAVASQYWDAVILEFRLYGPVLSTVKNVYDRVVRDYSESMSELDALRRNLILSIANHQARSATHAAAAERIAGLETERAELLARIHTLEHTTTTTTALPGTTGAIISLPIRMTPSTAGSEGGGRPASGLAGSGAPGSVARRASAALDGVAALGLDRVISASSSASAVSASAAAAGTTTNTAAAEPPVGGGSSLAATALTEDPKELTEEQEEEEFVEEQVQNDEDYDHDGVAA
ncbi:hypothetical protein BC828DRAFT_390800 [Blastocladiella britannica]|nr:hypothetical protein BC828DRAFT_390800 [Blastocladiella britannica]